MAYNDSGDLQPNSTYQLGNYSFELKVQTTHEPGEEDVVSVFAICHHPDGSRETVPVDFPEGTTAESWSVEANETEASVYAKLKVPRESEGGGYIPEDNVFHLDPFPYYSGLNSFGYGWGEGQQKPDGSFDKYYYNTWKAPYYAAFWESRGSGGNHNITLVMASKTPNNIYWNWGLADGKDIPGATTVYGNIQQFTHNGKTVYYALTSTDDTRKEFYTNVSGFTTRNIQSVANARNKYAWLMAYNTVLVEEEHLIARFAIDIREADGGPDGPWDEPGDVGDPSYTLRVSVTGATAGTHNSTHIPLEAEQQMVYGSGGIGGNGGGGGAGSSTIIIYDFATDKAGSVVQEAYIRPPGTGGPGGKGGRGADGCVIIFY